MPTIREYNSPVTGLNPNDRAVNAYDRAARRSAALSSQVAAETRVLGNRVAREAGQAVRAAGTVAYDYMNGQQLRHGASTWPVISGELERQWDVTIKGADPNDPGVARRFIQGQVEPRLEKFRDAFSTEGAQRWAEAQVERFRNHIYHKTAADMATKSAQALGVNMQRTVNTLSNTVRGDPSSLDYSLGTLESSVDAYLSSNPNLGGTQATKVRTQLLQRSKEEIVKSAALGFIEKTGTIPPWATDPKYSPYINGAELKQLESSARYYNRLTEREDRAKRVLLEHGQRRDFEAKARELETSLVPQHPGEAPSVPADFYEKIRELSKHPGAQRAVLSHLFHEADAIVRRMNTTGPDASISHANAYDFMKRISKEGDNRLTDPNEIYKAYMDHKLNHQDYVEVRSAYQRFQNTQTRAVARRVHSFMNEVETKIKAGGLMPDLVDPNWKVRAQNFRSELEEKIEEYRRAGKNPLDLMNRDKPDYMGSDAVLAPYKPPSMQQRMRNQSINLTAPGKKITNTAIVAEPAAPPSGIEPRKPGETLDEWIKRTGRGFTAAPATPAAPTSR